MKVILVSTKKAARLLFVFVLVFVSILFSHIPQDNAVSVFLATRRELPIYSVEVDEKRISISFDAAWGIEYTEDILRILKERDIKTTFFLVGFWIDAHPEMVKKIASFGHEIGNHSTTHPNMSKLSEAQIRTEIDITQSKIEKLAPDRAVRLLRPPYGAYNNRLITICRDMDFQVIQWDVDSLDWKEYGSEHMFRQVTQKVKKGSIVLFHNNAKYIADALPLILDDLIAQGYEIVPISELIYKENYYIDHEGRQRRK